MPYVVKDFSTGTYWTTSQAQSVDKTDVRFARVYPLERTAKQVATQMQDVNMYHYETEQFLLKRDGELPCGNEPSYDVAPDWRHEEI